VARVISANTLAEDSSGSVSQFTIRPSRQLQVIRLPESRLSAQHMYVQVSGEPTSRNTDFSSSGVNEGILKYRPDEFVPFKVPVFDEAASLLQEQAYKKAKKISLIKILKNRNHCTGGPIVQSCSLVCMS
jgi:hypothetical protein